MSRSDVGNYYGHRSKVVLNQLCHITALLSLMAASDAKRRRILHLSRSQVSSMSQGVYKDGLDPESVISGNCEILQKSVQAIISGATIPKCLRCSADSASAPASIYQGI